MRSWRHEAMQRWQVARASAAIERVLGFDHPLVVLARRRVVLFRQAAWVGALLVAGASGAVLTSTPWAQALTLSAALVATTLAALAVSTHRRARQEARAVITDGGETCRCPRSSVRRRLVSARHRRQLASRLEAYVRAVQAPSRTPWVPSDPFADQLVARAVRAELLAALLRATEGNASRIARAEHLLSRGLLLPCGADIDQRRIEIPRASEPRKSRARRGSHIGVGSEPESPNRRIFVPQPDAAGRQPLSTQRQVHD